MTPRSGQEATRGTMAFPLLIVESPTKARTLSGFLGDRCRVMASVGHVRDLPNNAGEVPKAIKEKAMAFFRDPVGATADGGAN